MTSLPVLSYRAADLLHDLIGMCGEFVPVILHCRKQPIDTRYFLFNCTNVIDAYDYSRLSTDDLQHDGTVADWTPLRLKHESIPENVNAFRCKHRQEKLIVSPRVMKKLVASNLSGWGLLDPEFPPLHKQSILSVHFPLK